MKSRHLYFNTSRLTALPAIILEKVIPGHPALLNYKEAAQTNTRHN